MNDSIEKMIENREGMVLYSDPYIHVILAENATTKGHVKVYPKKPVFSIDQLDPDEVQHLFKSGSIISSHLFEFLGAHGTNLILNEGSFFDKHLHLEIIARTEGDGINLKWEPKQMSLGDLETALSGIKDKAILIGHSKTPTETHGDTSVNVGEPKHGGKISAADKKYRHMMRNIRRLP